MASTDTAVAVQQALIALGIRWPNLSEPRVTAELVRIAAALQRRGCRNVGLVPADDHVGVPGIALHLALAFAQLTGFPTGVVDLCGTWLRRYPAGKAPEPRSWFDIAVLGDPVALLWPKETVRDGGAVRGLRDYLAQPRRRFGRLVVDLTGLDHMGEHLDAIALLDGVAVVARAGRTTELRLERWIRDIPERRNLGVLLVGT
jgi:hypothetical protein